MVHGYLEEMSIVMIVAILTNWLGFKKSTQDDKYIIGLLADNNHLTWMYVTVWAKICLVCTCQYFEKCHFENSIWKKPALLWYWTSSLSMIILSYLLAFVQLTWQVDNGWFLPVFGIFFMDFINIGPVYIREWVGGAWSWGEWWQKFKQRSKMTHSRAMMCSCTHKWNVFQCKA